ncbi:MAG: anti-sigma factor antagonist [Clostridiales bacterium]|nr:anti-sigma factor antagonist [Clostridiales bacterium]
MRTTINENDLTIHLEGRIDSNNAKDIETELLALSEANSGSVITIDAEDLEYISSAGLRALLKLRKQSDEPLKVINVSPEVYEIFDVTGFTQLFDVSKKLRQINVDGCEKLGEGGNGAVYRLDDDKIVKVYKPWMKLESIERERSFAKTAFVNGIPSVIAYDTVKVGDCLGVVFELLKSDTLGHAMRDNPERLEEYVDRYVALAKTLHSTHVPSGSFSRIQDVMHAKADNLGQWCSEEEIAVLRSIIDTIPNADTVTHNDLHPGNIMIQDGELVLIDMPEVTMGPSVCDLVSIYRDMISAPKNQPSVIEGSIGMPADLISKAGNMFFSKYTGITNSEDLEGYYKKLGLLYAFNVSLMPGAGGANGMRFADTIMNSLLRPIVIPNEQIIKALFQSM